MLFSIDDPQLRYLKIFDEFPNRQNYSFEFTSCFCGEKKGKIISTTSRHRNFMPIIMCKQCGSLRSNPYFTKQTAEAYYRHIYGPVKRGGISALDHQSHQQKASLCFFLEPYLPQFETVLDFGGGSGGRTMDLMQRGKKLSLLEVEGTYSQAAYDAGFSMHETGNRYDLVVVSHVIEHLLDPREEVSNIIRDYCKPEGLILIATPLIDYVNPEKWLHLFHIAHKFYFTKDALLGLMLELGALPIADDHHETFLFRLNGHKDHAAGRASYNRGLHTAEALRVKGLRNLRLRYAYRRLRAITASPKSPPIY
jgi:SAM-dependent methyltransferase